LPAESPDDVRISDNRFAFGSVRAVMPWKRTDPTKERVKLVLEWEKR